MNYGNDLTKGSYNLQNETVDTINETLSEDGEEHRKSILIDDHSHSPIIAETS